MTGKVAWNNIVAVVGYLKKNKGENYVELVETLVKNYGQIGCRMLLTVHILHAHIDKFKKIAAYLGEQDVCIYQHILDFERHYQGSYI